MHLLGAAPLNVKAAAAVETEFVFQPFIGQVGDLDAAGLAERLQAAGEVVPDLAAVVLPLTVPDLPVILWCRSPRLFQLPAFSQLAAIAQKVVLDSAAFGDPAAALGDLCGAAAAGRLLADLSWTRLTRWRELIAQIFENRTQLAHLPLVSDILISDRKSTRLNSSHL